MPLQRMPYISKEVNKEELDECLYCGSTNKISDTRPFAPHPYPLVCRVCEEYSWGCESCYNKYKKNRKPCKKCSRQISIDVILEHK